MAAGNAELEAWVRGGAAALQAGRAKDARDLFERVTASGRASVQVWMLLAQANRVLGDTSAQEAAVDAVLAREAGNIRALIWKGDCRAASDMRAATSFYDRALRLADGQALPGDLTAELDRASAATRAAGAAYTAHMDGWLTAQGLPADARSPRFREALDILSGAKQIFHQQPRTFYFPGLPQRQYYEREEFDWVPALEAHTDAMRAELSAMLTDRAGFRPYLVDSPGRPRTEFHGLTDNPDWSTLHLWEKGEAVADNVARAPRTFDAMLRVPLCDIAPRAPTIMFSLLKGGARIPAHTGEINTRLICHLPLVVPPGCGFRVGNEVRDWQVGKLLIFDDTIEHEAWNDSSEDRVVLIFDVWRPELTEDERGAVRTMFAGIDAYRG